MTKKARANLRAKDGRPAQAETVAMHALDKITDAADKAQGAYLTGEECRALFLCVTNISGPYFDYDRDRWREAGYDGDTPSPVEIGEAK